jgi:hypothetical protein
MYTSQPCSYPNSQSPMPASAIADQDARIAAAGQIFDNGDSTLNNLIVALGGNPAGTGSGGAAPGGSGVATGSTLVPGPNGSLVWAPPPPFPFRPYFPWAGGPNGRGYKRCLVPEVLPLVTVLPMPAPPAAPVAAAPIRAAAPPPPPPAAPAECSVNPSTICAAIQSGCVLSSQVSPAQLAACSKAGWAGNFNQYPALAARGGAQGGKYFGDVNLSPSSPAGLAGFGDTVPAAAPPWYCVSIPGVALNTCDSINLPIAGAVPLWGVGLAAGAILLMMSGGKKRR